ncbi:hypothetical protein [Rummeliibacillus stabekisii]|uniref:hypothetical protein n=1 Tax=Rummeliibacillus stabekisii TaxID=241244 RepID=UPI0011688E59|nr:hypothetical protein [Rummeliibacillus stabekisii]MBB5170092.1 hypothetical protein [Rummeliibacillus stabekisii]GEL04351.1 hypothetical protein RST01_09780 [Rummeliibacillus stabekisii]
MSYILPINDYQAAQYINRSAQTRESYSYVERVEKVKNSSKFQQELEQKRQTMKQSFYVEKKRSSPVHHQPIIHSPKRHTADSYDHEIVNKTDKGLICNLYV